MEQWPSVKVFRVIQKLNRSHNEISGKTTVNIVTALEITTALQVLKIASNNISDDGAIAISESLKIIAHCNA